MKDEQFELLMKSVNEMKNILKEMKRQKELDEKWESVLNHKVSETNPDKYITTTCEENQL